MASLLLLLLLNSEHIQTTGTTNKVKGKICKLTLQKVICYFGIAFVTRIATVTWF